MLTVKILGSGCANCKKLEAVAREAAALAQVEAEFVKVTDMNDILSFNVMSTPALVINGKVVMEKECPEHGHFSDIVWSDVELYLKSEQFAFDGIAAAIKRVAADPDTAVARARAGRLLVEREFDQRVNAARLFDLIRDAIGPASKARLG